MSYRRIPRMTPIIVFWKDACRYSEQTSESGIDPTFHLQTIGFFIRVQDNVVILGSDWNPVVERWRDVHCIPREFITKIQRLALVRRSPQKKRRR